LAAKGAKNKSSAAKLRFKKKRRKSVSPSADGDKGAALDLPPFEKGGRKLYLQCVNVVCGNRFDKRRGAELYRVCGIVSLNVR